MVKKIKIKDGEKIVVHSDEKKNFIKFKELSCFMKCSSEKEKIRFRKALKTGNFVEARCIVKSNSTIHDD